MKTPAASVFEEEALPSQGTHTSDGSWSNRPGAIATGQPSEHDCAGRQEGLPAEITEIAWKAQNRLHKRYMTLMARGKDQRKTMTAVARELLGFIWAIGIKAEAASKQRMAA